MRLVALVCVLAGVAHADQIKHPAGFVFDLPKIGAAWEQDIKGSLIVVADESDKLPELQVFVFPAQQEGSLTAIEGRLEAEIRQAGVSIVGEAVTTVKVTAGTTATVADASVRSGTALLNQDKATFAIVQRGGHSLILVGIPASGIFERGASNFRAIVQGLQAAKTKAAVAPPTTAEIAKLIGANGAIKNLAIGTAADGKTIWVSCEATNTRFSEVLTNPGSGWPGWQVADGISSTPVSNAAANKAAKAGKLKLAPLATADDDASVKDAVKALLASGFDAKRKDLIAIGSGPGERTTSGAVLAKAWKAAWVGKTTIDGPLRIVVAPSGTTAAVTANVSLAKPGKPPYAMPLRVFLVFDKADQAWTLVHAHFSVQASR